MNKYEATLSYRSNYDLGFWTMTETMDRIIDKWTEENGGHMDADEIVPDDVVFRQWEGVNFVEEDFYE